MNVKESIWFVNWQCENEERKTELCSSNKLDEHNYKWELAGFHQRKRGCLQTERMCNAIQVDCCKYFSSLALVHFIAAAVKSSVDTSLVVCNKLGVMHKYATNWVWCTSMHQTKKKVQVHGENICNKRAFKCFSSEHLLFRCDSIS